MFRAGFCRTRGGLVFHYFKNDLGRKTVSIAEFATAFESVLNGLGLKLDSGRVAPARDDVATKDLQLLAFHAGDACELAFFPRLRTAVHAQFQITPPRALPRAAQLRQSLLGAERWSPRCDRLRDQIVEVSPPHPARKRRATPVRCWSSDFGLLVSWDSCISWLRHSDHEQNPVRENHRARDRRTDPL